MRSKSYLFLLLVLGLGVLSGFLYSQTKYNYGLDVRGGIRLTYQMQLKPDQRAKAGEIRQRLIHTLEGRATGPLGVAEPSIVGKGLDQIVVELPGATNIEQARNYIGNSAKIQFFHAKTVVSPIHSARRYEIASQDKGTNPTVTFRRTIGSDSKEITPQDPEYARIIGEWPLILEGEDLASASSEVNGSSYQPLMNFSATGSRKMEEWSRRNPQDNLAAVLDGRVLSIAPLQAGTVLRDNAVINGQFDPKYVSSLVELLNAGSLPVNLKELSSETVDPTIGTQALDKIVVAGAIAFVVTAIFLFVYYSFAGFVAFLALLLYTLFTLTVLKLANATFSLAAIAGFILSVGMAVDANILVFERFKEEMKRGRSLQTAIDLGFRRALPAIFDSNACTILTSMVLAYLGTGPVKGFATTLIMGVIISLFTAITVTRSLLMFFVNSGIGANPKWYAVERNLFFAKIEARAETDPLPIVQKAKRYFVISAVSILILLPFIGLGGLKPNVEFRGGYEVSLSIAGKDITPAQIQEKLQAAKIDGANVKTGGEGAQRVAIITAPPEGPLKDVTEPQALKAITDAVGFAATDVKGSSSVGPTVQAETIRNAVLGVVISSLLIVAWLAIRFGLALGGFGPGLRFGLSAIGALVHDVLFVVGFSALVGWAFGWEISALFITSMLTVIGFSVHDTIVIFDRIRENLHKPQPGEDLARIMNRSISQSFARSVNTSMTVIATLIILLAFGTTTPDLKLFCATMLAGILSGTYSSIYNASPILYLWDRAVTKKKGDAESLVGLARREHDRNRVITTQTVTTATPSDSNTSTSGRSYGQVRRRANEQKKPGHIEIED